jgi:transmembrane sensor
MNDIGREGLPDAPTAKETARKAAAWIRQRDFWDWSETDQVKLDMWRAESLAHEAAFLRLDAAWNRTERLAALRGAKRGWLPVPRSRRGAARVVAGLAILAMICAAGANYLFALKEKTYVTVVGGHRTLALADGSQIELNTDTVLRLAADERSAFLDRGEAYFQIKHDAIRPFVVTTAKNRVTDLGTKFLVSDSEDRLEVSLVEGRARIETAIAAGRTRSAVLTQGDFAIVTADSISVTKKPVRELANELGWRHGVLVFKHTTLADAATEFNRYNRDKLVIVDTGTGRLKIDGTFPANDVKPFTEVAQDVFGLRVDHRGNETVISR